MNFSRAILAPVLWSASASIAPAVEMNFRTDVMAVLSKAGCNTGGCHGKQDGRGGFKLSLWGEDPETDYKALLEGGKRVNRGEPAASKILRKPTLQMKHEGEKRFDVGSPEYQILLEWIETGAKKSGGDEPRLESIAVTPPVAMLDDPAGKVSLKVEAKFSDGEVRDVTRWAVFESSSLLAEVDAAAELRFMQPAETTVFVRYLDGRTSMRAALIEPREDYRWRGPAPANAVDEKVFAKLEEFRQNPAVVCDDATFLRRVSLDITGTLPGPEEARSFVTDKDPNKRAKLVDRLLASPEYAQFWALKWADLLRVEEKTLDQKGVEKFHAWIAASLAAGKGLDSFAREVLTATGSTYANPPANFYRALRNPVDRAEAAAQVFLGSRLRCAKCHNHPFEDLRQDDYYRFAALFDGIDYEIIENKRKDKHDKHQFRGEQKVKLVALDKLDKDKVLKHPRTKKPPEPGLLDPGAPKLSSRDKRLEEMADWVIGQPGFARVQANRVWFHMTGRALVDPVDDVRDTNPASNPALMDLLAVELRDHGHDPRHLIRLIANSKTYQLASDPGKRADVGSEENFARATVRRYPAEVVIDAAHRALAAPIKYADAHKSARAVGMPGVEMVHLARDPGHGERFLKLFGKPARLTNSDSERSDETTLAQVFELTGGETLNRLLREGDNRIGHLLKAKKGDREIIETLYWATLTRAPSEAEALAMSEYLAGAQDRRAALEDVSWSLLNAKEFILRR